ncbi:hypothetical protein F9817_12780 [Vibrio sp. CAIM 722]|uniref:Uncharacterized protein n=1 Tax=Vibrio eleionomae TaxID=2653505 RepID=A0A7X4LLB8_9VIBR|nr:hypothetical protein [Vibrio eleionomae]MZI94067.1 hypothetical protein [Vibrio eleionomae]
MNQNSKLLMGIYASGLLYIATVTLAFSPQEGTIGRGIASLSGSINRPELLPWLLIAIGIFCALILIIFGIGDFFQSYKNTLSRDFRLLKKAKDEIREQTGIDHPVGTVNIKSLFNPTASLGIWMTSKGTWSRALSITLNPITYAWLVAVSFIKTFFVNDGFKLYLLPSLFSFGPLLHGLLVLGGIST